MSKHRRPRPHPPVVTPTRVTAAGAALGMVLGLGGIVGAAFAPDTAQAVRPLPVICIHPTEGDPSCPLPAAADASGLGSVRPIARPVTSTSPASPTLTATAPAPVDASTRPRSRSATANPLSALPRIDSGSPGSGETSTPVLELTGTEQPLLPVDAPPPVVPEAAPPVPDPPARQQEDDMDDACDDQEADE